jgi:hypothetical protein
VVVKNIWEQCSTIIHMDNVIGKAELFNLRMRSCSHTEAKQHKIKQRERPYQLFF